MMVLVRKWLLMRKMSKKVRLIRQHRTKLTMMLLVNLMNELWFCFKSLLFEQINEIVQAFVHYFLDVRFLFISFNLLFLLLSCLLIHISWTNTNVRDQVIQPIHIHVILDWDNTCITIELLNFIDQICLRNLICIKIIHLITDKDCVEILL